MKKRTGPIAEKKDGERLTLWIDKKIKRRAARLAKRERRSISSVFEGLILEAK